MTIKRALIAVYDKTGVADFARTLVDEFGIEILSTGGTARHLKDAGVPVTMVEEVTGSPEMLDGRVKTLHPKIHGGILADRDKPGHLKQLTEQGIAPIDMVVVNLYPFEDTISKPGCTFAEAVEMIDIGGPCMLRAAAKNHKHVAVVCGQDAYEAVLGELREHGDLRPGIRRQLAANTFAITAEYDIAIHNYMMDSLEEEGEQQELSDVWFNEDIEEVEFSVERYATPRYGENPHQRASVWLSAAETSGECSLLASPDQSGRDPLLAGEMSFNNYSDGNAALELVKELGRSGLAPRAVAFIKHMNACGCAIGDDPVDTYRRAYLGDPVAAAGGVLCMNFPVTREIAETVMNSFGTWGRDSGAAFFLVDVWIAPSFDADALELITTPTEKRTWGTRCRLLAVGPMNTELDRSEPTLAKITGGILVQERDMLGLNEPDWKVVSKRTPSEKEMNDLRFAWLVCKHTKSNAITICRDGMLLGSGAGQMSRVKSCDLAIQLATENGHAERLPGAVAAGDAFFPVSDGPQKLIDAGVKAIIHPGGSKRDEETVKLGDAVDVAMIMTGTRHFKH